MTGVDLGGGEGGGAGWGPRPALVRLLIDSVSYGASKPRPRHPFPPISPSAQEEEASFSRTLVKGIERFKKSAAGAADGGVLSGGDAFLLWDTYGFPLDLTQAR